MTTVAERTVPGKVRQAGSPARGTGSGRGGGRRPRRAPIGLIVRRIVVLVLALGLVAGTAWLVGFSPVLDTRRVVVTGVALVPEDVVRAAAAVPLGLPLARQDVSAVRTRVAAQPTVESVRVRRRWPHTIEIAVTERTASLALRLPGGIWLADRSGVVFQQVSDVPNGVLPAELDPADQALLVAAGQVADSLPRSLQKRVTAVTGHSVESIGLVLSSGVKVTWGTPAESALKAQLVERLLKRKPKAIDVSAPHDPAIR